MRSLDRRTFLRGTCAAIPLPFLEAMLPSRIVKQLEDRGNGLREFIHLVTQSQLMRRK